MQDFNSFSIIFYCIISTTYQKIVFVLSADEYLERQVKSESVAHHSKMLEMAGQNTFQILLLNDANMIMER